MTQGKCNMIEYLKALKNIDVSFSVESILDFLKNMSFPVATVAIALLILFAVQGYKIFKSLIYVFASVGLAFAGHLYLAPRIVKLIGDRMPDSVPIEVSISVAFVCAMFGVFLAHFAHEFIIFCMGGVGGYCLGFYYVAGLLAKNFGNLQFLKTKLAYIIVGVVCALILAVFLLLFFKYLYIFITSVGFMGLAGYILSRHMITDTDPVFAICFATLGILIGFFMMIHQFDEEEKCQEFHF